MVERLSPDALDELRNDLVVRFSPAVEDLDPVPRGLVEQSRRFAQLARLLVEAGAFDYEALAEGWDVSVDTARKRVARAAERRWLFTASYRERTFVPAFLLTERLEPRLELRPVLEPLMSAGDDGFSLWAWLTTPSSWLDGAVPEELARTDPQRVASAARQRAGTIA